MYAYLESKAVRHRNDEHRGKVSAIMDRQRDNDYCMGQDDTTGILISGIAQISRTEGNQIDDLIQKSEELLQGKMF